MGSFGGAVWTIVGVSGSATGGVDEAAGGSAGGAAWAAGSAALAENSISRDERKFIRYLPVQGSWTDELMNGPAGHCT